MSRSLQWAGLLLLVACPLSSSGPDTSAGPTSAAPMADRCEERGLPCRERIDHEAELAALGADEGLLAWIGLEPHASAPILLPPGVAWDSVLEALGHQAGPGGSALLEERWAVAGRDALLASLRPEDGGWTLRFHATGRTADAPTQAQRVQATARLQEVFRLRPLRAPPERVGPPPASLPPSWGGLVDTWEVYAPGEATGRWSPIDEEEPGGPGEIGWSAEGLPALVEPLAGYLSGTPQSPLSHTNVWFGQRGRPSAWLPGLEARPIEGWFRLQAGAHALLIAELSEEQAVARRAATAPAARSVPLARTDALLIPDDGAVHSLEQLHAAYGGKAAPLFAHRALLPEAHRMPLLAVPLLWSLEHAAAVDLNRHLTALDDPAVRHDRAARAEALRALRRAVRATPVAPQRLATLLAQAEETFGRGVMLRLRSSANAEDLPGFAGAGLYRSVSGCPADDLDGDEEGPSRCDPDEPEERTVERALLRVWASLWRSRAWLAREEAGIDHREAAMGVLLNPRFRDERADIVAFSGPPVPGGPEGVLVQAMPGELRAVSPPAGSWPEGWRVSGGRAQRLRAWSGGTAVLEPAQVDAIAEVLDDLVVALALPPDQLFDSEWKWAADGQLVLKQLRRFERGGLIPAVAAPPPPDTGAVEGAPCLRLELPAALTPVSALPELCRQAWRGARTDDGCADEPRSGAGTDPCQSILGSDGPGCLLTLAGDEEIGLLSRSRRAGGRWSSLGAARIDHLKLVVPLDLPGEVPVFLNSQALVEHFDALRRALPERYGDLDRSRWNALSGMGGGAPQWLRGHLSRVELSVEEGLCRAYLIDWMRPEGQLEPFPPAVVEAGLEQLQRAIPWASLAYRPEADERRTRGLDRPMVHLDSP